MENPVIFVGTYHKTGTVWIHRVMRDVAKGLGTGYFRNNLRDGNHEGHVYEPGIYFDDHTYFPAEISEVPPIGFRMIRDPRDVVISGAHYHTRSEEGWLHMEREDLNGKTYQQAINAFEDVQDRYLFEMQRVGNHTINCMAQPNSFVEKLQPVRYEDLMTDSDFSVFTALMQSLGLRRGELKKAEKAFRKHSLVGDAKSTGKHGTSNGQLARWKTAFSRETARAFAERHGDALIRLGYEQDHSWVDACHG